MYVVANRVPVAKDWEDTFEERFRKRAGQIEKNPGFLSMQILKPVTKDTPFTVLTHWQDQASFEAWVQSEDFKLAHQNPMPKEAFNGEGKLEMFEVIISAKAES